MARPVLHGAHPRAPRPMLHPEARSRDARQRARRTRNRRRGPYGLERNQSARVTRENAKRRACVHSRGRVHARRGRVRARRRVIPGIGRRVFSENLFRKCFGGSRRRCGAPASVCPRRASRRWTTSDGYAKTWTGCWRCTPPRWWTSRRSADRTCASSWRSARRARAARRAGASAGAGETLAGTSSSSEVDTSGRDSEKGASDTKDERSVAADTKDKTARATRRAGGDARGVGLPSAVHAELYKNTGGDPLHTATLANLLVSCGAVSVIQKGVGGVPEVVFKAEPESLNPGAAATNILNSGLSSAAVARMHARDAAMESLERRLSADAFSALNIPRRVRGRVRAAQAHAPWRAAWRRGTRCGSKSATLWRRCSGANSSSTSPSGWTTRGRWRRRRRARAPTRMTRRRGKTTAEHVADPRAVAPRTARALRVARVGGDRRARQGGRARRGLGRAGGRARGVGGGFRGSRGGVRRRGRVLPPRRLFCGRNTTLGEILKVSDVHAEDGTHLREHGGGSREVRARSGSSSSASVSGRATSSRPKPRGGVEKRNARERVERGAARALAGIRQRRRARAAYESPGGVGAGARRKPRRDARAAGRGAVLRRGRRRDDGARLRARGAAHRAGADGGPPRWRRTPPPARRNADAPPRRWTPPRAKCHFLKIRNRQYPRLPPDARLF